MAEAVAMRVAAVIVAVAFAHAPVVGILTLNCPSRDIPEKYKKFMPDLKPICAARKATSYVYGSYAKWIEASGLRAAAIPYDIAATELETVLAWVERFDRRGTEPFELFRSEFGQNSVKIMDFARIYPKFRNSNVSTLIFF